MRRREPARPRYAPRDELRSGGFRGGGAEFSGGSGLRNDQYGVHQAAPRVPVMQAADVRDRNDAAAARRLDLTRDRCIAVERQVASRFVVVREVVGKDPQQMSLIEDDHVIQALATNRADQPLDVRILPRRAVRDDDFFDAQVFDALTEIQAVDSVVIPNHETRCLVERKRFDDLLGRPTRSRVRRHIEVHHATPVMPQHDEAVKQAETDRGDDEKVDRDDVGYVVGEERAPGLGGRLGGTAHVLRDCRLGHVMSQQRQLGLDSRRSPGGILLCHLSDEPSDLCLGLRTARLPPRLPAPVEPEAFAMPTDNRFGFDDHQARAPARPMPRQQDPE